MKCNPKKVVKIIILSEIFRLHIPPLEKFLVHLNILNVMCKILQTLNNTRLLNIKLWIRAQALASGSGSTSC